MSEIDWNNAPEGCVGYSVSSANNHYWMFEYHQIPAPNFGFTEFKFHSRPKEEFTPLDFGVIPDDKPIYTKAMSNHNILPRVGMECMVFNGELSNPEYEKCTIDFIGCHIIIYSSKSCTERTCHIELVKFKQIDNRTPEEKASEDILKLVSGLPTWRNKSEAVVEAIKGNKIHGVTWSVK